MNTRQVQGEKHILVSKELCYIANWREWKEIFEKENKTELIHSLLHFGFKVPFYEDGEDVERVCLYLDLADSGDDSLFPLRGVNDIEFTPKSTFGKEVKSTEDLRGIIRKKAYQVLVQDFFKRQEKLMYNSPTPYWAQLAFEHPEVLSKLLWFFRSNKYGSISNLRELGREHYMEVAESFALEFCTFAWDCDNCHFDLDGERKEIFQNIRADTITILFGLNQLGVLLDDDRYKKVDDGCIKKLRNIVMEREIWMPSKDSYGNEHRKPETVEEACVESQAARVLLVLENLLIQKQNIENLQALQEERREKEKKFKTEAVNKARSKLTPKEKKLLKID